MVLINRKAGWWESNGFSQEENIRSRWSGGKRYCTKLRSHSLFFSVYSGLNHKLKYLTSTLPVPVLSLKDLEGCFSI